MVFGRNKENRKPLSLPSSSSTSSSSSGPFKRSLPSSSSSSVRPAGKLKEMDPLTRSTTPAPPTTPGTMAKASSSSCLPSVRKSDHSSSSSNTGGLPTTATNSSSSSTFKLANFTKTLLARAQTEQSGLSPATLQSLINPMRSQLGLPCLSLNQQSSSVIQSEDEVLPFNDDPAEIGVEIVQEQLEISVGTSTDDSGVDSSNFDKKMVPLPESSLMNKSFSETDVINGFGRMTLDISSETSNTNTLVEGSKLEVDQSQRQDSPEYHNKNFQQNSAAPLLSSTASRGGGNSFHDVAAIIPRKLPVIATPLTKKPCSTGQLTGGLDGIGKSTKKGIMSTPINTNVGQLVKEKVRSTMKEKKSASGWKFASEHIQGKEYLIIKQLGKGGCGEVLLVIEKESRALYALKRVNLSGIADAGFDECVNEVETLVGLRDSELVVHIFAWEFDKADKTMKILMEHGQTDLQHSIKNEHCWTLLKLRSVWERLLTIVDAIHKRGVVHADLKPANFIWAGDNLKIIDFGISSHLQQDHTSIAMLCPKGTLNFISPETIQPDALGVAKIGPKSDIWALGCILYLMVYGRTPFDHISHPMQKIAAIVKGQIEYPPVPQHLSSCGPEIVDTLKLCFEMEYRRRPTTEELLQHPLVKGL